MSTSGSPSYSFFNGFLMTLILDFFFPLVFEIEEEISIPCYLLHSGCKAAYLAHAHIKLPTKAMLLSQQSSLIVPVVGVISGRLFLLSWACLCWKQTSPGWCQGNASVGETQIKK